LDELLNSKQHVEIEFLTDSPGKWFHHFYNLCHMEAGTANLVVYQSE